MPDTPGTINFPTSLDTAVTLFEVANRAYTTMSGSIGAGDLSISVANGSLLPSTGAITLTDSLTAPTKIEHVIYTVNSSNTLTVPTGGRGFGGSTAQSWSGTVYVRVRALAQHHSTLRSAIIALETKLGAGSATATANTVLRGTGSGTTDFGTISNAYVASDAAIALSKLATVTASRAMISDVSGVVSASAVTATELGYVSGVTSAIQTQIDGKQAAFGSQTANYVYAGPTSGGAASPSFRALVSGDLPSHNQAWSTITSTPTTLSGYGITDAQPLDGDLTAIAALTTTAFGRGLLAETNAASLKTTISLGNVENTALSTWAGSTNITTLGTIAAGTWNGSVIGSAYGGAGTVSGILKANGAGTVSAAVSGTDYAGAGAVTSSGLTMATARLLGRSTASTGAIEEIAVGSGLTLSAGTLTATGGGITVGTTTITSGTNTRVLYNNSGVVGEYAVTGTGNAVLSASPTLTGTVSAAAATFSDTISLTSTTAANNKITQGAAINIGTTSTDGIILQNTTAAAAGAQQYSPRLRFTAQGWKTTATAASQTVDWIVENVPVQNSTNPTTMLTVAPQVNGGGYLSTPLGFFYQPTGPVVGMGRDGGSGSGPVFFGTFNSLAGTGGAIRTAIDVSGDEIYFTQNSSRQYRFANGIGLRITPNNYLAWTSDASTMASPDLFLRRSAAANLAFGNTAAASPVAQTLSVQDGTGTNTAGATFSLQGSLGTSQGAPGRIHLKGGALIAASGTTAQTAVDRAILNATKVLTNNSATTITNVTAAASGSAGGQLGYYIEVTDGTDYQYEVGVVSFGVTNKGGVFSGNTCTKFGNHQDATSGTLTVTFAISGANPAVLSVNANSSLSPSTGYPRIVYWMMSGSNQAVSIQ